MVKAIPQAGSMEGFFAYARERQSIFLRRRRGVLPPWTEDPVLQKYSFCNIFREDDKTTIWFRQNIRDPLDKPDPRYDVNPHHKLILATVAFRWFNRIETGEHIKNILLHDGWNEHAIRAAVSGLHPLITGAYIIMPRPGVRMGKLDGICWCMERFKGIGKHSTLQEAHTDLMQSPGLGPFMAYEVITDLRHTHLLRDVTDINTWANPGPGAKRGLWHVYGTEAVNTGSQTQREARLTLMQQLLQASKDRKHWPSDWPQWDMRTVEHTLCEYDKYVRGQAGKHLKRRYRHK